MIPVKNLPPSNLHLTVASTPLTGLNILRGWLTASPPHPSAPLAWFWMRFRHTGQALGFLASSVMHPWFPDPPNLEVFEFWGPSQWSKKKTTMLVDSVHSLMCSFRTPFFMRGIHTSNIIFPLAVDQKNVFSIFFLRTFPSESPSNLRKALHDDKASTSHCVAGSNKWRKGAPEDRNLQVGGIFADLGFLGLGDKGDKKGMLILQTQRLLTKIIQNRENLLIHFKLKILIFILHPILHTPPQKKKRTWSSSQCCTSLLESLERRSHWAAARALWKCRSRRPDFRCTERSTGLTTSSWEAFTQAPIPISCEQNQATTATLLPNTRYFAKKNIFEYHLVTLLEGCSHSLDSKCSQHVTYCSKTWYFFTIPDCVIRNQKNSALKPSQASPWSVKLPHAVQGI